MILDFHKCPICNKEMELLYNNNVCINNGHLISYDLNIKMWAINGLNILENDLIRLLKLKAFW